MIYCSDIVKKFQNTSVLKGVSLSIDKGQLVSIVGSSGAGKSTLLHILGTLDDADSGQVILNGVDTRKLKKKQIAAFRNQNIGFIFQFHHLLPEFTALENACMPAYIAGKSISEAAKMALPILESLGVSHRLDHKPAQLSGGEQQRVAVARALINRPKIIFADEPTGNLDKENADEVFKMLLSLRSEFNITMVIVTHDPQLASQTDKTYIMQNGLIIDVQSSD
ncbi:MAG TPA: ABC transporter ATP-binding protein [Saprospiraceae bacterium]|nr:ABC transporter ATP-binding protein [Saprospiraceae bacterium]